MKRIGIIIVIVLILILGIYISLPSEKTKTEEELDNPRIENGEIVENIEKEKEIDQNKAEEIFEKLPKMYVEAISPFAEEFKLNAVMESISSQSELLEVEPDFSEENVNKVLKELFGENETLNKEELTMDKVQTSIYYYSEETESYAVLPVGFNGVYLDQELINVTETNSRIYVYVYCLVGEYFIDDNGKINAVIGDKEGKDLELSFDSEIETSKWIQEYKEDIPIFRYTLEKKDNNNYLIAVEQTN